MKKFLSLASLFLLSGCVSTMVPINDAKQAPADRAIAFQCSDATKSSILTVIRDEGVMAGGGCYMALWINKTLAARLDTSEVARFCLEPGELLLRVGRDPQGKGLCATGQDHWIQRETVLGPSEQKTFRMTTGFFGEFDIIRTDMDRPKI